MSQSYTSPFTGDIIQPTDVSFNSLTIDAGVSTPLQWSTYSNTDTAVAARIMHITPAGASAVLNLPPASQAATGSDILLYNNSGITFNVADADGTVLSSMPAGVYRYFYLTDNSTTAGVWDSALYGSGTATLPVASVAGYGIDTANGLLNTAFPIVTASSLPTITAASRATFYVYTGGAQSSTLPSAQSVGNDFFVVLRNAGTGALTLNHTGTDTIDGSTSLILNIGDSCVLVSAGTSNQWFTYGRGRNTQFQFNLLTEDVGLASIPGDTYTLSTVEASNTIQIYTDVAKTRVNTLTVFLPNTVQTYFISNQTGVTSYDIQFQLVGSGSGTGSIVTIKTGQQATVFSDGTNLYNANTVPISGSSSTVFLSDGTVSNPSLNFLTETNTGLYHPAANSIGITVAGTEIAHFDSGSNPGVYSAYVGNFAGGVSGGSF